MAGYDFDFRVPVRLRDDARKWLRYVQCLSDSFDVRLSFRTRVKKGGQVEISVTVDGPLPAIQHLSRHRPESAIHFLRVVGKPMTLMRRLLLPFLEADKEAVDGITDTVFEVADEIRGRPVPPVVSTKTSERLSSKGQSRVWQSAQEVVRALDGWLSGTLSPKDALILCDQAIEDWLKARLELPSSSTEGFHQVVNRALGKRLIENEEASRLRRYHSIRNRVQHRRGKVGNKTVLSMFGCYVELINL